jgi:hypothetical protein
VKEDGQGGELNEAEPMLRATSSSVLRSNDLAAGDGEGPGAERREAPPASGLPCHNSNSCIEWKKFKHAPLSPYRKKSRDRLIIAVERMVKKHGVNHVGLLTLSFGVPGSGKGSEETRELREKAKDLAFVQARWHSFASNVITKRYEDWICVLEPHKDGVWHLHVVVSTKADIRTGTDIETLTNYKLHSFASNVITKRYEDWICVLEPHKDGVWHLHVVVSTKADIRTGTDIETLTNYKLPYWQRRGKHLRNEALAAEWRALRETCCKYRFGRAELLPIKKTGEALARYVAGYLSKSFGLVPSGRRNKLVRYSRNLSRSASMRFSPNNLGNLIYRTRLKMAAEMLHFREYGDFADYFGPRWHYYIGDIIASIPVPWKFAKGDFESGLVAKVLSTFAADPLPFLSNEDKAKMTAADAGLSQKFDELAFDEASDVRWQESTQTEADNIDVGPVTDLQNDLIQSSENPF